jgi:uncharacterized protein (TIGR00288 family)
MTTLSNSPENRNMAVFCDFENVALGVEEHKGTQHFDINRVLERLLLKGNIVVKKAYCDWSRYNAFKRVMHEASFELIDIPHVSQSGKNSADIRMVVDALDLCYTKSHVDTFVIISGDSDFSPLVSKLRENAKQVIGVGVKNSTSSLLTSNCDEFIFYDDLIRQEQQRGQRRRRQEEVRGRSSSKEKSPKAPRAKGDRKDEAYDLLQETYEALVEERGDNKVVWGSMVKQTLRRRRPDFHESYYGFASWNELLEGAGKKGILKIEADEKSGGYMIQGS